MNRQVDYAFEPEALEVLRTNTDPVKVNEALAYLSTWNFKFPFVRITISYDGDEMTAYYCNDYPSNNPFQEVAYVIGAVWHDDHFGFHS